jgi:hypothetical protein
MLEDHKVPVYFKVDLFKGEENYLYEKQKGEYKPEYYKEEYLEQNRENVVKLQVPEKEISQ